MASKESTPRSKNSFANASESGEISSYDGSEKAKATDYANYFCSYAQLYHQKQMLVDHNRMAAYHSAIMGNSNVFKDKVVMDVGTGSGILAVWAAQAGARRVYAVEYTDMAKHAESVMEANGVSDIVKVIQGAVEDIELPKEDFPDSMDQEGAPTECVDIIISEWMGYFLLRESMLDSLIRARDKFMKKETGLMFPSHTTMYFAPISDEEERRISVSEYTNAMGEWSEFVESTKSTYGVNMATLQSEYDREQKEYYLLSSRWAELSPECVLSDAAIVKDFDMATCTVEDSRGIGVAIDDDGANFHFDVMGKDSTPKGQDKGWETDGPISGFAGWFTADFKSRTDEVGRDAAPKLDNPTLLNTGPDNGYTHWGQQVFHFLSSVPVIKGEITSLDGTLEMTRSRDNARLYNCRIRLNSTRKKIVEGEGEKVLMKGAMIENVYQIP